MLRPEIPGDAEEAAADAEEARQPVAKRRQARGARPSEQYLNAKSNGPKHLKTGQKAIIGGAGSLHQFINPWLMVGRSENTCLKASYGKQTLEIQDDVTLQRSAQRLAICCIHVCMYVHVRMHACANTYICPSIHIRTHIFKYMKKVPTLQ